jgi:hypothetical protein
VITLQRVSRKGLHRSARDALLVIPGERVSPPLKLMLATEILVAYVRVRRRMTRTDLRVLVSWIRSQPKARCAGLEAGSLESRLVAVRLANAVIRTLRIVPTDPRCLEQALVLSWLLSARTISHTLVIGAHSRPDFEAHAWVEHLGRPLLPAQAFGESRLLEI